VTIAAAAFLAEAFLPLLTMLLSALYKSITLATEAGSSEFTYKASFTHLGCTSTQS